MKSKRKLHLCRIPRLVDSDTRTIFSGILIMNSLFIILSLYAILQTPVLWKLLIALFTIVLIDVFGLLILKMREKPIVLQDGISIPLNMASPALIKDSHIKDAEQRLVIDWKKLRLLKIDSRVINQWEAFFLCENGFEIKISSEMAYKRNCLSKLIQLAGNLKKIGIEVSISKTALELVEEYRKEGK